LKLKPLKNEVLINPELERVYHSSGRLSLFERTPIDQTSPFFRWLAFWVTIEHIYLDLLKGSPQKINHIHLIDSPVMVDFPLGK
jgi:hypothetical protein